MIELISKLPRSALNFLSFALLLFVLLLIAVTVWSISNNTPITINDKKFGFGSSEIQKKETEIKELQETSSKNQQDSQKQIAALIKENSLFKEQNTKLLIEAQTRAKQDSSIWLPVDDITFEADGKFQTYLSKRTGKGVWSNTNSELTLRALTVAYSEATFETNQPPPHNIIRLVSGRPLVFTTSKMQYQLEIQGGDYSQSTIRITRRISIS